LTIAGLVLAAGESTRMGRLKQLLPWDGRTLVEWQVEQLLGAGIDDVVVVVGHEAELVGEAAGRTAARIAVNEAYREGRASSVRAGAEALDVGSEAVIILSVDQPRPGWVSRQLLQAWQAQRLLIVMPGYGGRRGHPIVVHGALIPELQSVTEAELGLRAMTQRHAEHTLTVPIDSSCVVFDLNTPGDYEAALAAYAAGDWDEPAAPGA
jgi:molybdenum cofactor cytidylyltransferase